MTYVEERRSKADPQEGGLRPCPPTITRYRRRHRHRRPLQPSLPAGHRQWRGNRGGTHPYQHEGIREALFRDAEPMRIAIETGTHSPWISRMLEECAHEILVANARKVRLISYGEGHKTHDKIDAEKLARLWPGSIRSCSRRSSTTGRPPRRTSWRSSARAMRWLMPGPS
jgi:hypothetical protein